MHDLLLKDARLSTPLGILHGWLAVTDGRIAAMGMAAEPPARETLDCEGRLVLPGGIDPHVHFRDPGFPDKETFATGSLAAAAGGVTTIFDMPNTSPAVLSPAVFEAKREHAARQTLVDFGLYAAVDGSNLDLIPALADSGAIAFKVFMYERPNPPPHGITDDGLLLKALKAIGATGLPACVHAENEGLVRYFTEKVRASGRTDALAHLDARPAVCEVEAVGRAILLAAEAGARLHICHMSAGESAARVRAAKERGQPVTAETGPQNLFLNEADYDRLGPRIKMTPPVRGASDGAQLWEAILDGTVDMLATDHAPHTAREKLQEDVFAAASGLVGVETTLPLMLTAVSEGRLTLARLNELRSEMPARVFGLFPRKGVIQVGSDADLVLVDPQREWIIQDERLHSRSRVSPFHGKPVRGAVMATLVRGQIVYRDNQATSVQAGKMVQRLEV